MIKRKLERISEGKLFPVAVMFTCLGLIVVGISMIIPAGIGKTITWFKT